MYGCTPPYYDPKLVHFLHWSIYCKLLASAHHEHCCINCILKNLSSSRYCSDKNIQYLRLPSAFADTTCYELMKFRRAFWLMHMTLWTVFRRFLLTTLQLWCGLDIVCCGDNKQKNRDRGLVSGSIVFINDMYTQVVRKGSTRGIYSKWIPL